MNAPSVTVAIVTFRPCGLDMLFSTLAAQTYNGAWEVVLVDEHHAARVDTVQAAAHHYGGDALRLAPQAHPEPARGLPGVLVGSRAQRSAARC